MEGAIVPLAFTIQNRFVRTVKYIYKPIKSIKNSSQVTFFVLTGHLIMHQQ